MSYTCSKDRFFDVHTDTCMDCSHVCNKSYETEEECQRLCAGYIPSNIDAPVTSPLPEEMSANENHAIIVSLVLLLVVLVVMVVTGAVMCCTRCSKNEGEDKRKSQCDFIKCVESCKNFLRRRCIQKKTIKAKPVCVVQPQVKHTIVHISPEQSSKSCDRLLVSKHSQTYGEIPFGKDIRHGNSSLNQSKSEWKDVLFQQSKMPMTLHEKEKIPCARPVHNTHLHQAITDVEIRNLYKTKCKLDPVEETQPKQVHNEPKPICYYNDEYDNDNILDAQEELLIRKHSPRPNHGRQITVQGYERRGSGCPVSSGYQSLSQGGSARSPSSARPAMTNSSRGGNQNAYKEPPENIRFDLIRSGDSGTLSLLPSSPFAIESLPEVNLISGSADQRPAGQMVSTGSYITDSYHGDSVISLYELFVQLQQRYPWIVGRLISSDHLEIVVDLKMAGCSLEQVYSQLTSEISREREQLLVVTTTNQSPGNSQIM